MNNRFKIGDKVVIKENYDGSDNGSGFSNKFTRMLEDSKKDIFTVADSSYISVKLEGFGNWRFKVGRFKKYEGFEFEEELFII